MSHPDPQADDDGQGDDPVATLDQLISQLTATPTASATTDPPAGDGEPEPVYSNLDEFVRDYLAPTIERYLLDGAEAGMRWCRQWHQHPEVVERLYAVWRAWETLRLDPTTGISVWFRDHLDPHLAAMTSENGPLKRCQPHRHDPDSVAKPLPVDPAPAELLAELPD